jgi:hypothetical protein
VLEGAVAMPIPPELGAGVSDDEQPVTRTAATIASDRRMTGRRWRNPRVENNNLCSVSK